MPVDNNRLSDEAWLERMGITSGGAGPTPSPYTSSPVATSQAGLGGRATHGFDDLLSRYAPAGGGRYGNQNMQPIFGGGMGQVIPTNIPFRDQGYGAPMRSQNLIQSLSGPNNLMNPYRSNTTLDMLDRFRGGGGGCYAPPGGGGYPPGGGGSF